MTYRPSGFSCDMIRGDNLQSTQALEVCQCVRALAEGARTTGGGIPNSAATVERGPTEKFLIENKKTHNSIQVTR